MDTPDQDRAKTEALFAQIGDAKVDLQAVVDEVKRGTADVQSGMSELLSTDHPNFVHPKVRQLGERQDL
ncbi:hypothetical protein A3D88_04275 [Candidatus Peribacteria bacterium RIFCSPHIGHO2_02_FULL_52_16]|nr:MAG: hypothetical protein A2706_01020 [Candidatus Peribacteria bacterium RIFCSPHIGHO2_01_FULL_51_35]OGJ60827.1 MAG: hypothetical protein A3D88_04275 [Candidatus Peribacteria bacterium RIFCSPHIGHO2_02_FULL_52_16]